MQITNWLKQYFGGQLPQDKATEPKQGIIRSFFEPILHPHQHQNKKLLQEMGITKPSESMYKNKMLMKTLRDYLHCDKGKDVTQARVEILRTILDPKDTRADENKLLDFLKQQKTVTDKDYDEILDRLQAGDVIAFFTYENPSKFDAAIRAGQYLIKPFVKGTTSDSHNVTHLMMVVSVDKVNKTIKIAEATPDKRRHGVRTLDFKHESFRLYDTEFSEYRIYRNKDEKLAKRAGDVAKYFAPEKVNIDEKTGKERGFFTSPTPHSYSVQKAVKSLFKSSKPSSTEEKNAQEEAENYKEQKKISKSRSFFCAELVGFTYLTAKKSLEAESVQEKPSTPGTIKLEGIRPSRMTPQKFIASHNLLGFEETGRIIPNFREYT